MTSRIVGQKIVRVKTPRTVAKTKTVGTVAVEKHRPLLNKLSAAERRRLSPRAGRPGVAGFYFSDSGVTKNRTSEK